MKIGTPGFRGDRLREARRTRQISIDELAVLIGVSRQAVSDYEHGKKSPRPEVMEKLCLNLGLPYHFFINEQVERDDSVPVFYRSLARTSKCVHDSATNRMHWYVQIMRFVESYLELPEANLPSFEVPDEPTDLTDDRIEEMARDLRRHWGLGDGPIGDVTLLLENNGIAVSMFSFGSDDLDAFSHFVRVDRRPYVVLNSDKMSACRLRFNAMHEVAHLVLHRNLSPARYRDPDFYRRYEKQAHRFAAAFLFPKPSFQREVVSVGLGALVRHKERWKASVKMMIIRAHQLGRINSVEYQSLLRRYQRQWGRVEPLDESIPVERPRLAARALVALVQEANVTRGAIASGLDCGYEDVVSLAGIPASFFDGEPSEVVRLRSSIQEDARVEVDTESATSTVLQFRRAKK